MSLSKIRLQTKKLGDVCDIYQPKTIATKELKSDGEYLVYGANGVIGRYNKFNHEDSQLLITCRGATCGSVNISEPKSWINGNAMVVKPIDGIIDREFLTYFFRNGSEISKTITGSAQPQITRTSLAPLAISFPESVDEQKRIVKILDEVFDSVAKVKEATEKNLKNAREVFESYLQSVFENQKDGWRDAKIGDIVKKTETIDPTKNPEKKFIYLDLSSVNKENLNIENPIELVGKNAPSRARKLIKTDDVIFATVRPTLGRVAMVPNEYNQQVCSTGYFVLRTKEEIISRLLFYYLLTKGFNEKIEKLQKGASYPAVTDSDIKSQIIYFPISLTEQKQIVAKLDALSAETKKLEEIYKQKLTHLEELKKSILKKAFNGEL